VDALILVDIQNDFMPGGALAVRDGDAVVPAANELMRRFDLVVATQDWHPPDHGSFVTQHPGRAIGDVVDLAGLPQVLWPPHCIQRSRGAELHPALERGHIACVFRKGEDARIDSYSGFFDNGHRQSTGLADYLAAKGVQRVWIAGLATDYCVLNTALDARQLDLATVLVRSACRAVELRRGDEERAVETMRRAGVLVGGDPDLHPRLQ
jgi:nicotinamidase/pyrazinamidase